MTRLVVKRESLGINTKHTSPSYIDGNDEQVLISTAYGLPTVSTLEGHIIQGDAYSAGAVSTSLADGASLDLAIAFGSGVEARMNVEGISGGNGMGYFYENATVSGGTPLGSINLDRNSTNTSNSAILLSPTVSSTGTTLAQYILIGGVKKKAAGGDVSSASIILKPLTTYLLRLTNNSGSAQPAEIILTWYE
jgi:hypothetical protein